MTSIAPTNMASQDLTPTGFQSRIVHHLGSSLAKLPTTATIGDWRMALSLSLRDLIIEPWLESDRKTHEKKGKRVYYLSMEFLIGRLIEDAAVNLGAEQLAKAALEELGQDYAKVVAAEPDAALGNGGLGRLAACFLDSMSTLQIPAFGYGIRYEHGLFEQHFEQGRQIEKAETWLAQRTAWEFKRPEATHQISFGGEVIDVKEAAVWKPQETVMATAFDTPIVGWQGKWANTLRLWSAQPNLAFDLDRFNDGDYLGATEPEALARTISRVLYPDDTTDKGKELRLKQEYFFTAASIMDIIKRFLNEGHELDTLPSKVAIQLNDTHPAIAGPELIRQLVDEHGMAMDRALNIARDCLSYTNHTLLPEALERWPEGLFSKVLPRHYQIIEIIQARSHAIDGHRVNIIEDGSVKMGELAFLMAHRVNGVSAMHSELVKTTVFTELHAVYPERIVNQTNGITPRRWLYTCNPGLRNLLNDSVGDAWPANLEQIQCLEKYENDNAFLDAFMDVKKQNKVRLANWIQARNGLLIDPESMFDVQIKRVHEYKRQLMNILEVIALWNAIRDNPNGNWVPRVKIFGGKAAPGYRMAKSIIHLINDVARIVNNDPITQKYLQVVYPENYNVSMAEILIPATDLSEQISTAGKEASGTGNMKLSLNGALTIGTLDGANVEIREKVGDENFFKFGLTVTEADQARAQHDHSRNAIEASPILTRVLGQIASGIFSEGDTHRYVSLLANLYEHDYFLVCSDFDAYYAKQRDIDNVFVDTQKWAKMSLLNTARLGWFSSDRTIQGYAEDIWGVHSITSS